ncbi:hypothetical protein JOM56_005824 [Amanita muscaria]
MFSQPFFPPSAPPNLPHFAQIHPPFSPIAAHYARNSISLLPGQPPFPVRHRKQLSIGGPPKAVLGGPQRKPSPLPPSLNPAASTSQKQKKVVVNLPKETIPGDPPARPEWARNPIDSKEYHEQTVFPVEATSQEIYPPDSLRQMIPNNIDVFLPSQHAWDALKQQVIEAKLEQLGVERGSGSNVPHIYAPHARAASISSPADPALLMFKLNKLQQQQQQDGLMSPLLASPQPPFAGSSPRFPANLYPAMVPPGSITNRHGHTLSLVQPPSYQPPTFDTLLAPPPEQIPMGSYYTALSPAPRPTLTIKPSAVPSNYIQLGSPQNLLAPTPALSAVHPRTRLDFVRGFGLETPEEVEEEETKESVEELAAEERKVEHEGDDGVVEECKVEHEGDDEVAVNIDDEGTLSVDATTVTGPLTRIHSRHESKLSASLSVPSRIRTPVVADVMTDPDLDAVGEWTGSEDLGPSSDNESIGEWSNPSDEEQARNERAERRMCRRLARQQLLDKPRRIPNFPRPPAGPNVTSITRHQHRLSSPQPHLARAGAFGREEGDEDIISNPSEEARFQQDEEYLAAAAGNVYASQSPIPQLNHFRSPSTGQYSGHDPAQAHSRTSSDTFGVHYQQQLQQQGSPAATLNPCAKPFVFGSARQGLLPAQMAPQLAAPPNAPRLAHSPLPSVGDSRASISSVNSVNSKPLNVSAPEFKPGGFNFRPPPGVPQMPTLQAPNGTSLGLGTNDSSPPDGVFSGPLPQLDTHPLDELHGRQGREKRQRRNSSGADLAVFEEGDSMRSFRFPANMESPKSLRNMRRSMSDASVHQRVISSDKGNDPGRDLEPFTYATFSTVAALPYIPLPRVSDAEGGEKDMEVEEDAGRVNRQESTFADDSTAKNETRLSAEDKQGDGESDREEGTSLFKSKKRPPLPLDFTQQPTRKNTVPAGLFKALASANGRDSGDDRTRKSVRSRLSSRDFLDEYRKPSLDDIDVPRISSTLGRSRFVTDPENTGGGLFSSRRTSDVEDDDDESDDGNINDLDDVFAATRQQRQHRRRGSSLPSDLHDVEAHEISRALAESPGIEVTTREDMQNLEASLIGLMEDKFTALERILRREESPTMFSSKTEAMIGDMVSLFRAQLQESATRSLEDSQMDARGEMDFQLIKDVIDEGHKELATMLRKELTNTTEDQTHGQQIKDVVIRAVEDVGSRTVSAIVETIADFAARQEVAVNRVASAPVRERDALVEMAVKALSPVIAASHADPIDYEFLTSQLAQAVKPHISQLIDLASDKRETAGLIVDRILPLLPSQEPINIGALTLQLTTEVRRAIAPIDAHEIKEQVADLVIERLDSRLAVRDKAFNVDAIAAKVTDGLSNVIQEPVTNMKTALEAAVAQQKTASLGQLEELTLRITELPAKLAERIDGLAGTQDKIISKLEQQTSKTDLDINVKTIMANIHQLIGTHKDLESRDDELLSLNKEILDKLLTLPDALLAASTVLSNTHSALVSSLESSRREVEELRKLNTDYQVQMTKARGAHGQVRVEKDALNEKLIATEAERERLRSQIQDLQSETPSRVAELSSLRTRNAELEDALAQALGRLQAADVSTSTNLQRLTDLEQANNDMKDEKQALQATIESLNMQLDYANREKDAANQSFEALQKENDELSSQQTHWDSLRLASEKIDALTNLIGQADNEELKELRLIRDRANVLEVENASLQKHFKEIENKLVNSEKAGTTVRQTLAQAQQRSAEWERRAREAEGQLEYSKTRLEQSEQTRTQMEADLSLVKLQLEEREAGDRLAKDREAKLRDQIAEFEARTTRLHTELEKTKTPKLAAATAAPASFRLAANDAAIRPQSRTSTIYDLGSPTPSQRPVSQASFNSGTPPGSVWDSMHAPRQAYPTPSWSSNLKKYPYLGPSTPRGQHHPQHYSRPAVPSPTPSTVSLTPTQGEDGWWS